MYRGCNSWVVLARTSSSKSVSDLAGLKCRRFWPCHDFEYTCRSPKSLLRAGGCSSSLLDDSEMKFADWVEIKVILSIGPKLVEPSSINVGESIFSVFKVKFDKALSLYKRLLWPWPATPAMLSRSSGLPTIRSSMKYLLMSFLSIVLMTRNSCSGEVHILFKDWLTTNWSLNIDWWLTTKNGRSQINDRLQIDDWLVNNCWLPSNVYKLMKDYKLMIDYNILMTTK